MEIPLDPTPLAKTRTVFNPTTKLASFCVVLPMYNEEANVKSCIETISSHLKTLPHKTGLIVVNDGSKDRTAEIAKSYLETLPSYFYEEHTVNQGYGAANITGGLKACAEGYDYVLFMDGDLTQRVSYIDDFALLMDQGVEFIKATRYAKGGGVIGVPFKRWLVSYVGNRMARMFLQMPLTDYTNGFRAIRAVHFKKLKCNERGFAYLIEEASQMAKLASSFGEVPYVLSARTSALSSSKFSYSLKTYINYLKYLFK